MTNHTCSDFCSCNHDKTIDIHYIPNKVDVMGIKILIQVNKFADIIEEYYICGTHNIFVNRIIII